MHRLLLLLAALMGLAVAVPAGHWVNTWVAMPQLTEYASLPDPPFNGTDSIFTNSTIRQTLHTSIAAPSYIRVRISNTFGVNNLSITQVGIGLPLDGIAGTPEIVPGSMVPVTFSGNQSIAIPNGAQVVSDPVHFPLAAQSMMTVDLYTEYGQQGFYITSHPGSRTTSWYSFGNYVGAQNMSDPSTQSEAHWFFLSGIEAWSPLETNGWVIIGDSITDGYGSDTNGNNRWPDLVLQRMQDDLSTAKIAVLNQAAAGNRILSDGHLSPNALSRIDRDVLTQSGIKYAMIFEGVNDITTTPATSAAQQVIGDRLIQAYQQIVARVHTFGIPIFAATLTPFGAPNNVTIQTRSDPLREQTRVQINDWIMGSGVFDGVIDFASVVADPTNASRLNPEYNSGDFLHPNVAGYTAMANAFPLELFEQFVAGVDEF